jgi:hypothetical protein
VANLGDFSGFLQLFDGHVGGRLGHLGKLSAFVSDGQEGIVTNFVKLHGRGI